MIVGKVGKNLVGGRAWSEQEYLLDKMTLTDLIRAYLTYPTIQLNAVLAAIALAVALYLHDSVVRLIVITAIAVVVYSLVEYLLHRFVLHARVLYRSKATAALWKRVHFDHHQDPSNLAVLFGDMRTTWPPIFVLAAPPGYLIHGVAGAAAAVFCAVVLFSAYEFCHCFQHLAYEPKNRYFRRLKKRHLLHHFHNETGNFGITSHFWDLAFGTNYDEAAERSRSENVRDLGYAGDEVERYPWVKELSNELGSVQ